MTTVTVGPTQPSGFRTIADANALSLSSGDIVQFESIDESGPFATSIRLALRSGVTYRSLDFGHKWGILGVGGLDLNGVTAPVVEDYLGDGAGAGGSVGVQTIGASASPGFVMRRYELCNYPTGAMKSTHGQWADHVLGVTPGTGPNDSGWVLEDGLHRDNAPAGSGMSDWFHYGSGLTLRRVLWRSTGGGDHAFYPKGRGLRMFDCGFDQCVSPLSLRCGDQLAYRLYFDGCVTPITSFPYDFTGLGGKQGLYGVSLRGCSAPGGALLFFDENNHEAGGDLKHADYDVVVFDLTVNDSSSAAQGFDFRDFTIAGRHVKLRNVAHGKNVTAPFRTGYTAGNLDSDYSAYPNGGKPAGETHSITPASLTVSEATLLPSTGSALLGAGTTTPDGTDYTPRTADIGFKGYPAPPSVGGAVTPVVEMRLLDTPNISSATPGGTFTPGAPLLVDDQIVYVLALNENSLGDLSVTPPTGYTLRASKSTTDRDAVYIVTRKVQAGDTLSGVITLPNWLIQDSTPANQARNCVLAVGVYRGVHTTTPVPASGTATGGNSTAQAAGATAATTMTAPVDGSYAIGAVAGKPGQTGTAQHSVNTGSGSLLPAGSVWVKRAEVLSGTTNGAASITGSVFSAPLATASQALLAVSFATNAQWAIAILVLAPAVTGGSSDTTPPDAPAALAVTRQTGTSVIVKADPTDYGDFTHPPGPGGGFADVGSPLNWWKLTQSGGLRPSFDSFDPSAILGPRTNQYYLNASLRDPANPANLRGTPVTGAGVKYYPRSQGFTVLAIDFSDPAHFKVTLDAPPPAGSGVGQYTAGKVVQVRDLAAKAGSTNQFKPKKPNGQYTIQSIAGSVITFTTGANTTGGTYNPDSGFVILEELSRQETVLSVDVTEASIASASDANGALFLPFNPAAPVGTRGTPANPWVLQHGAANAMSITGATPAQGNGGIGSLSILIPPWFDLFNCSPEYLTFGGEGDPQLYNPFCHLEFTNCHVVIQDGMGGRGLTGTKPGVVPGYSEPLSDNPITIHGVTYQGLVIPVGESIGWGGCSGVVRGLMNHDFLYDANKFGSGAANLRWEYASNFRNRWLVRAGGGHTDCYQIWDLDNSGLGPFTDVGGRVWPLAPTWYRCFFENGGNAMLFLNDGGGSGSGRITDVWALECIPNTGNKFLIAAGAHNVGARRCLLNGVVKGDGGMEGVRPDPLDFGSNNDAGSTQPCGQGPTKDNHPCPSGNLIWPDSATAPDDVNLRVLIDGSTTTVGVERLFYTPFDPLSPDRKCRDGTCFTYID